VGQVPDTEPSHLGTAAEGGVARPLQLLCSRFGRPLSTQVRRWANLDPDLTLRDCEAGLSVYSDGLTSLVAETAHLRVTLAGSGGEQIHAVCAAVSEAYAHGA
jgi:hypothetical protein